MEKNKNVEMEDFEREKGGSGVGGKIIAVALGFVIGAGSVIGGVAGLGYWAVKRPIKDVEGLVQNAVPNLDLSQYLTSEYYNGTVLDLLGGVKSAISDISSGKGGFSSLAKISPVVKTSVRELAKKAKELGSNLAEDDIFNSLMDLPFADFGTYLTQTLLKSIELGPMLLGTGAFTFDVLTQDNLMMTLLYGVEGEDYNIVVTKDENGDEVKKIEQIPGGRVPLSVGEIQDGGIDPLLSYIPVDALLTVNEGDGMMCSLAYGKSAHYSFVDSGEKDENGNPIRVVRMTPRAYTSADGQTFYDEEGVALDCTAAAIEGVAGAYALTFKDSENKVIDVQYVREPQISVTALGNADTTDVKTYSVFEDEEFTKVLTFKKTTFADLMDNPESLLGSMEIATVMDLKDKENLNPILAVLAYGQEGEDFIWEEKKVNGEVVKDEDGNPIKLVKLLPGKQPKTIDSLQGDNLNNLITDLPLASILTSIDTEDQMMMALAYGSNTHYSVDDQKKVTMKQVEYKNADGKWFDIEGNELRATLEGNVLTITEGEGETASTKTAIVSYDSDKQTYFEVDENGNAVLYKKTTVGDLQDDPMALLDTMEIASLMDITADSNPILLAIAYGIEDEDYKIVETVENGQTVKTVQPINGSKPKKLSDLQGENLDSLVSDLPLASLLEVDTDDHMMMALAYGSNTHYSVDDQKKVTMKQVEYTSANGKWYDIEGNELRATLEGNVLTITEGEGETASTKTAIVSYDSDKQTYFEVDENGEAVLYKKTTVGDLQDNTSDLLDTISVADLMGITADSNSIMIALAYGVQDEDYKIVETVENGQTVKTIQPINGSKPKTLGDLSDGSMDDTITNMPLDAIMNVDLDDGMMTALAYGATNRYNVETKTENGETVSTVHMKQVEYTKSNDKWLDIDGNEVNAAFDETTGILTITEVSENDNGTTATTTKEAYIVYNAEDGKYYEFKKEDHTKAVTYKKTTVGDLQDDPAALIDKIELGEVLNVHPEDESSDKLMLALAYGNKGTHYDFHADGTFYFLNGNKARTIGDLRNDQSLFKSIYIGDALDVNQNSHSVLIALAYGEEGTDFEWVDKKDENGNVLKDESGNAIKEVHMLGNSKPRTIEEMQGENSEGLINSITLESALGVNASSDAMMRSLAYGQEGVHYEPIEYEEKDGNLVPKTDKITMKQAFYTPVYGTDTNTIVAFKDRLDKQVGGTPVVSGEYYEITLDDESKQYIKQDAQTGNFLVYTKDGENYTAVPFKKTTLGQLSSDSSAIMDGMTLADALGIDENETDGLKRSLAFDKNGNAYTIGDLSENPNKIIDSMYLSDAIGIDGNSDPMMRALAFGRQDVHYQLVDSGETDANGNVIWTVDPLQAFYTFEKREGDTAEKMYDRFGVGYDFEEISHEQYAGKIIVDGKTQYLEEVDGKYYAYDESGAKIYFAPTTIAEMSDHSAAIMDDMTLADAMGIDKDETDGLKRSLAFDKDGNPYTIGQFSEDPNAIVNDIALADALGVTPQSERMIIALAYGQKDIHYQVVNVDGEDVIDPTQAFYTLEQKEGDEAAKMYDRFGASYDFEYLTDGGEYEAMLTVDGEVQYLDLDENGNYYVYDAEGNAIDFAPTTIGQLNAADGNGSVINSITLADALNVDINDTSSEASLKHALAFSNDGHAYTIGELSENPNDIVDNIHLDSVLAPEEDNAMTMYLLYGKEGVHFRISELTNVEDIPQGATVLEDSYTADKSQAKYIIMLHKQLTIHQKQESGEDVFNKDGTPVMCVHNEYGEELSDHSNGMDVNHHTKVTIVPESEQEEVEIDGQKCNVKYTFIIPDESTKIHRLLLPQNGTLLEPIRVKGYYTYNEYEPAYYVQVADCDEDGNVISEWRSEYYTPNTIASLTESDMLSYLTERLTLEEVLDEDLDQNPILKPIAHTTIGELPGAVDSLTIAQVFENDVYKMNEAKTYFLDANDHRLYYNETNNTWYTSEDFADGTQSERVLEKTWKYLLTDKTPTYEEAEGGEYVYNEETEEYELATEETPADVTRYKAVYTKPEEFKVNDIGALVENMTHNIQTATLKELVDDGIITVSDKEQWEQSTALHNWTIVDLLDSAMNPTGSLPAISGTGD